MTILLLSALLIEHLFMGDFMNWSEQRTRRAPESEFNAEGPWRSAFGSGSKGWFDTSATSPDRPGPRWPDGSQNGSCSSRSCRSWPDWCGWGAGLIWNDHSYLQCR